MSTIKKIEYRGFNINVEQDENAESPREWDNMGKMVCLHNRYNLGDKHDFKDGDEVMAYIKKVKAVWLPLYLYDHSGLTMNTTGFQCPWDSGQVGVIYMTPEEIEKEYPKAKHPDQIDKAKDYMKNEVRTYDDYLTGSVYGYTIEPKETNKGIECDDACWGYYGDDGEKYMIETAKESIDYAIKQYKDQVKEDKRERKEMDRFMASCWAC